MTKFAQLEEQWDRPMSFVKSTLGFGESQWHWTSYGDTPKAPWFARVPTHRRSESMLLERTPDEVREQFEALAAEWQAASIYSSSVHNIILHPAYQRIIGLGPRVLPHILSRLAVEGGHWFWALAAISGEDAASGTPSMDEARERWLEWGRNRGYFGAE